MNSLTLITGNAHKAKQVSEYLKMPLNHLSLDLTEIQSLDPEEVIEHKLKEAFEKVHSPVIVDDTSLVIHSMGLLPGPFIKYFLHEIGQETLCKITHTFTDTSATANVSIGFYDGTTMKIFSGELKGSIAKTPVGDRGFGWDPIFIPEGYQAPRAALDQNTYDAISPRKKALEKLKEFLTTSTF